MAAPISDMEIGVFDQIHRCPNTHNTSPASCWKCCAIARIKADGNKIADLERQLWELQQKADLLAEDSRQLAQLRERLDEGLEALKAIKWPFPGGLPQ